MNDKSKDIRHVDFNLVFPIGNGRELHYGAHGMRAVRINSYSSDGMVLYNKNLKALNDGNFRKAYEAGAMTVVEQGQRDQPVGTMFRSYLIAYFAELALRQPGCLVELGVNTGAFSTVVCVYHDFGSQHLDRRFILIDTFEGIPEDDLGPSEKLALGHNKEYIDNQSYQKTKDHFAKYPQIEVVQGRVPDILENLDIPEICFLHIDMNNAYAERAGLEALWDRIVPNGVVVFDDYGFAGYEAQTDTIDEFVASVGERVCVLPSGQGFLIKR